MYIKTLMIFAAQEAAQLHRLDTVASPALLGSHAHAASCSARCTHACARGYRMRTRTEFQPALCAGWPMPVCGLKPRTQ